MKKTTEYLAWVALVVSLLLAAGVIFAGMQLEGSASQRAKHAVQSMRADEKVAYENRLRILAGETAAERAELERRSNLDVIEFAKAIEQAGADARVQLAVSGAQPDSGTEELGGEGKLQAISFILDAEGSYAQLMHALALLEQLPYPSVLTQVELGKNAASDANAATWRLSARLRVLTTMPITL